jgi:hypothetical protein
MQWVGDWQAGKRIGLRDEDHLGDFPLSWKVTVEQYSIEELC